MIHFHLSSKTISNQYYPLPISDAWERAKKALATLDQRNDFELTSLVLMANHYHMLAKLPYEKLYSYIHRFHDMTGLGFELAISATPIFSPTYLERAYRYIYQNPMKAGLCKASEFYPYSTLFYLVNQKEFPAQIYDRFGPKDEFKLFWLNQKVFRDAQ